MTALLAIEKLEVVYKRSITAVQGITLPTKHMIFVRDAYVAMGVMLLIGAFAGFFVVPMNALLQHRGHILMGAGHSIAVQNFNENLSILVMLGVYSLLIKFNFSIYTVIVLFGVFVAVAMTLVRERHYLNLHRGAKCMNNAMCFVGSLARGQGEVCLALTNVTDCDCVGITHCPGGMRPACPRAAPGRGMPRPYERLRSRVAAFSFKRPSRSFKSTSRAFCAISV